MSADSGLKTYATVSDLPFFKVSPLFFPFKFSLVEMIVPLPVGFLYLLSFYLLPLHLLPSPSPPPLHCRRGGKVLYWLVSMVMHFFLIIISS